MSIYLKKKEALKLKNELEKSIQQLIDDCNTKNAPKFKFV